MYKFSDVVTKVNISAILPGFIRSVKIISTIPLALFGGLAIMDFINILMSKSPQIVVPVAKQPQVWLILGAFYLVMLVIEIRKAYRASRYSFEISANEIKLYKNNNISFASLAKSSVLEVFEIENLLVAYYKKKSDQWLPSYIIFGPFSSDCLNTVKNDFLTNGYEVVLKRSKSLNQS